MQSARAMAFWEAFRRHEGLSAAHFEATHFRTSTTTADRLLEMMLAGRMRATIGPTAYFGPGKEEPLPAVGDYAILIDTAKRPRLIWRTTSVTVAPLPTVSDEFIWRSGEGTGERDDWLARIGRTLTEQAPRYGFEMHPDIETVFETLEVVWPDAVARRIRLVSTHLDRGAALLNRLAAQNDAIGRMEAILTRVETAVLTVGPGRRLRFTNPAADAMLGRGDGLTVCQGRLSTRHDRDARPFAAAVSRASAPPARAGLVAVHRDESRRPYQVNILPLRNGHPVRGLTAETEAILLIDDPDAAPTPAKAERYRQIFDLTPAEARLAAQLAAGISLSDAADALQVTYNTVRAQLRAIFDKTGAHRQGELIRVLQDSESIRISVS